MSIPRDQLLRPSLDGSSRPAAAPYSVQTGMWSAFFGGPLAAIAMIGINAWRAGRVRRDVWWIAALLLSYLAWTAFVHTSAAGAQMQATLASWFGRRGLAYADRLLALMMFLLGLWLHRAEQRSADLFALKRPNGWIVGLLLIAAGFVAGVLLIWTVTP